MINKLLMLPILLLSSFFIAQPAYSLGEVVSVRELQEFMYTHYPRASTGPIEVMLFSPSVEMISKKAVRLTFEASAMPWSMNSRYRDITAAVEGELIEAEGHLVFNRIIDFKMDVSGMPYEYRPITERAIYNLILKDYVANPILQLRDDEFDKREFPNIGRRPIRIVGGTDL